MRYPHLPQSVLNNTIPKLELVLLIPFKILLTLNRISKFLHERDTSGYIVGGFVRDQLLHRHTSDIDITVAIDALDILPELAASLNGKYFSLDEINRIGRILLTNNKTVANGGNWEVDVSTLKNTLKEDLSRRDFSIDAMAINLETFIDIELKSKNKPVSMKVEILDPFNGYSDLKRGIIRIVQETAFQSDPIRLLRSVRLANELNFHIEKTTENTIRHHCSLLSMVAGEKIREELVRVLELNNNQLFYHLDKLGLLTAIIPDVEKLKGVTQPKEHYWDVFTHSLETVAAVDFLLRYGNYTYATQETLKLVPWSVTLADHFNEEISTGSRHRTLLKLAALLHDIAKPQTKTINSDGRTRFLGHTHEGATIANSILERLRFSRREIDYIATLIKYHLRPGQMSNIGLPTKRAIYRYFRDTEDIGIDILFLSLADHLASRGPCLDMEYWQKHVQLVDYVIKQQGKEHVLTRPSKLIDGHDLIDLFNVNPGPQIGKLLEMVREAQAATEIKTREQALSFVRQQLENRHYV
jgi:poly(A) polymerase